MKPCKKNVEPSNRLAGASEKEKPKDQLTETMSLPKITNKAEFCCTSNGITAKWTLQVSNSQGESKN